MEKIGIYGGSFDPIHFGHLNLALELMEKKGLNKVWFIPANTNPHKLHAPPSLVEHRLHMLALALKDIPQFILKDIEAKGEPPSYTIHTLRTLVAEAASDTASRQFYLLMGEDTIPGFFHWYLPEEIVELVPLLIGSRSGTWQNQFNGSEEYDLSIRQAIQKGLVQTKLMDISGTEIRERLGKGLYCGHLVPPEVLKYIKEEGLYQ